LAVCEEKKSEMNSIKASKYTIIHAPAESTPVDANSQDMASLCLVAHESPKWVSESIFKEAYRILKPGGIFTMLDLDKENLGNVLKNPFVTAIYKHTEPYMSEFLKLDPMVDLKKAGFDVVEVDIHSSPIYPQTHPFLTPFHLSYTFFLTNNRWTMHHDHTKCL
jgi:ubiquinone/menaquinone biosynthesis C-methylase UbiE